MADAETLPPDASADETPPAFAPEAPAHTLSTRAALAWLRRLVGAPPYRLDIGRIASIIVVPVFCWVFYTTSSGMIDIMRRESGDLSAIVGAIIGTTAILVMLAATSWSLGADLGALIARRQISRRAHHRQDDRHRGRVPVRVLDLGLLFLHLLLHQHLQPLVEEARRRDAADGARCRGAAADLQGDRRPNMTRRPRASMATHGVRAYLDALDALLQTSSVAAARLDEGLQKSREGRQRIAREAARRKAAELEDAQAAARRIDGDARAHGGARPHRRRSRADHQVPSRTRSSRSLRRRGRRSSSRSTRPRGSTVSAPPAAPIANRIAPRPRCAQKRIGTLRETLAAPTGAEGRGDPPARRARGGDRDAAPEGRERDAGSDDSGSAAAEEEPAISPARRSGSHCCAIRFAPIRAGRGSARRRRPARRSSAPCGRRASPIAAVPADFACEPKGAEAHDLLTARDEVIAGRAAFDQKCSLDGAIRGELNMIASRIRTAVAAGKSASSAGFDDAKRLVDDCVVAAKAAGLPEAEVQSFLKRSDESSCARTAWIAIASSWRARPSSA